MNNQFLFGLFVGLVPFILVVLWERSDKPKGDDGCLVDWLEDRVDHLNTPTKAS